MVMHGRNVYMKGVFRPKDFSTERERDILGVTSKIVTHGTHNFVFVREYFPMGKINSRPDDTTAYQRGREPNMLAVLIWDNDTPEKSKFAKERAYEIIAAATGSTPLSTKQPLFYGNYSKYRYQS